MKLDLTLVRIFQRISRISDSTCEDSVVINVQIIFINVIIFIRVRICVSICVSVDVSCRVGIRFSFNVTSDSIQI